MEEQTQYNADIEDEIIDYDGEIANDGDEFTVLPDGDTVVFTVREIERGHNKDGKTPRVRIGMVCESVNGHGQTFIDDFISMTKRSEWKLCEFFRAIGLRQHGQRLRLRWDIIGHSGHATVKLDKWTGRDGDVRENNKIKKYLDPATVEDDEAVSFE